MIRLEDSIGLLAITELLAGVAQLAEHNVANVVVVGSNPITRSFKPSFRLNWPRRLLTPIFPVPTNSESHGSSHEFAGNRLRR